MRLRIFKEIPQLFKNKENRFISKIITDYKKDISFSDVPAFQECKIWFFKDEPKSTLVKKQLEKKK